MNKLYDGGKLSMTDNDFYKLKEELFNQLKQNDNNTKDLINKFKNESKEKIESCTTKCDEFAYKLEEVQNTTVTNQVKLEKLAELDKFKTSASDQIFTQNVKIVNMSSDFTKFCNKYDKIYLENLELPGTIRFLTCMLIF